MTFRSNLQVSGPFGRDCSRTMFNGAHFTRVAACPDVDAAESLAARRKSLDKQGRPGRLDAISPDNLRAGQG